MLWNAVLSCWLRRLGRPNSGVLPTLGQRVRHRRARLVHQHHFSIAVVESSAPRNSRQTLSCLSTAVPPFHPPAYTCTPYGRRATLSPSTSSIYTISITTRITTYYSTPPANTPKNTAGLPTYIINTCSTSFTYLFSAGPEKGARHPQRSIHTKYSTYSLA